MQIRIAVVSEYQLNIMRGFDPSGPGAPAETQRLQILRRASPSLRSQSHRTLVFLPLCSVFPLISLLFSRLLSTQNVFLSIENLIVNILVTK